MTPERKRERPSESVSYTELAREIVAKLTTYGVIDEQDNDEDTYQVVAKLILNFSPASTWTGVKCSNLYDLHHFARLEGPCDCGAYTGLAFHANGLTPTTPPTPTTPKKTCPFGKAFGIRWANCAREDGHPGRHEYEFTSPPRCGG